MNAVTVLLFDKNGNKKRRVKIRGSYSSFLVDGSTQSTLSDDDGRGIIIWSGSTKSLKAIHVNGKTFKNKYVSGSTHTLTI